MLSKIARLNNKSLYIKPQTAFLLKTVSAIIDSSFLEKHEF